MNVQLSIVSTLNNSNSITWMNIVGNTSIEENYVLYYGSLTLEYLLLEESRSRGLFFISTLVLVNLEYSVVGAGG